METNSTNSQPTEKKVKQSFDFKKHFNKHQRAYCLILYILSLILIFVSVARVPYVGQFIDSVVFSFIFGYSKYFIYLYLIYFCCLKIFNVKLKPLYSKRYLLGTILCSLLISMLLGGINILAFSNHDIKYYIDNIWYQRVFDFNHYFYFGSNDYIDAGIIGAIISSIPGVFIIILALILIIILFFMIFSNYRKKTLNKLFKYYSKKYSLNLENSDLKSAKKTINNQNISNSCLSIKKQQAFNLNDNYSNNDINIEDLLKVLAKFLNEEHFLYKNLKVKENEREYIIAFDIEDDQVKQFEKVSHELKQIINYSDSSIYVIDNTIYIKLIKVSMAINDTLKNYLELKAKKENDYVLCFDYDYNPLFQSLTSNNIIGLMIDQNQNYYEYLNALSAYLSVNYDCHHLQISYLSLMKNDHKLLMSQNVVKNKIDNVVLIDKFLTLLNQKIDEIEKLYRKYNVNDLDALNKVQKQCFKKYFIFIDNIDQMIVQNKALFETLNNILKKAYRYGIVFMLIDNSKDIISKSNINYDLILNFNYHFSNSEKDVLYDIKNKTKQRIILPKLRNKELNYLENKLISIYQNLQQ